MVMSSASGGFVPRPPSGLCLWTPLGEFLSPVPILYPLQNKFLATLLFITSLMILGGNVFQSSLTLGRSSELWMLCTMSSRARDIEHGRRYTSQLWRNISTFVSSSRKAISPKKACTNIRTFASRYVIY